MKALSSLLEEPSLQTKMLEDFSKYILEEGDISQQLISYFSEVVGEHTKTMKVLKSCHQKIILPGYYYLKAHFYEEMPFRDKRGSWNIVISINNDNITVMHIKRQQSTAQVASGDSEFEFQWELTFTFNSALTEMTNVRVVVTNLTTHPDVSAERANQIMNTVRLPDD